MDIKTKALTHALQMLNASGAQYVVIDSEGNQHKHGNLEVVQKSNRKRRNSPFPHGTYATLIKESKLKDMAVGDVLIIEAKGFNARSLRSSVITSAERLWGRKSVMTTIRDNNVETLRIY